MPNKSPENGLKEFIECQLPMFDEILADSQKPLSQRPFAAALYFVDYCIVDIKRDNKEKFLEKDWFKSIYKIIKQWYRDRYAEAMNLIREESALGIILIYKTPFQLNIPLSIAQEKEGNDKRWFCLPNSVLENENAIGWIENKPNTDHMPRDDLDIMKKIFAISLQILDQSTSI